jgi:aldehyde dehydrogenase (NAD+)
LELGGKSPCIVDREAEISITAKRIAWSKAINAGQTCIAPDYLFVHSSIKEQLVKEIISSWEAMLGKDMQQSPYYNRMINEEAYDRISGYLANADICYGGKIDASDRYISPTLIDNVTFDDPVMKQEIFGPLLPIITFTELHEIVDQLIEKDKPLAMYYYGKESVGMELFQKLSFGGGCINDGLLHVANHHLPFGGVGNSGQGRYHGKASFDAFTHYKGIMSSSRWFDLAAKYPPYKYFNYLKRFV